MQYRQFGALGWRVSEIGFGAWAIGGDMWGPQDDAHSIEALHRAIDLGVNFIDTAQGYGNGHSEEIIGKVLADRSETVYVATKVPPSPGSPWPPPDDADASRIYPAPYIISRCEESLKRLKRDCIDLYQFHTWAPAFNCADEWFEAMSKLKQQGKIRAIGVSVPDTTPDNVIGSLAQRRVDAVQVIYNLFEQYPRLNLFPVCERLGIGVVVRVPFDEGALTGKFEPGTTFPEGDVRSRYFRGTNLAAVLARVEPLKRFAARHHPGTPLADLALRFCLEPAAVGTVIPGIRNGWQAERNCAVADGVRLGPEEAAALRRFAWRKDFWHDELT